jgi:prolyl-tRNA synthetase
MRQSQLFTRTTKELPKDEVSTNAQLLIQAGYIDKLAGGIYSYLPLGLRSFKKIEAIIREEMNALGSQELLMPALHTKQAWEPTGRWDTLDVLYKIKDASQKDLALGPTHEEIVVPLVQKHIQSYKDLPFSVYQIQTKFRMELRSKSGILRGREFSMKDLYSFHVNEEDLDTFYTEAQLAYEKIFARVGLKDNTFLTYASGGSFSKYSHEYQTLSEAGEDTIHICDKCMVAINEEIIEETPKCPRCGGEEYRPEKSIEVGNIFKLRDRFTKPFKFTVKGEDGHQKPVLMGCYGIGLGRVLGTVAQAHHDQHGLIWPESVAPYKVHILSLYKDAEAEMLYEKLQGLGMEVLYDDRDISAGEKFADADLIGIPYRVVVSKKTLASQGYEVKERKQTESQMVSEKALLQTLTRHE